MIRETLSIIGKNLRLLVRSRSSALIVLFGPLFLMLLVGFAFNSVGTRDVEVGIYAEGDVYTELSKSYVQSIAQGPFHTLRYHTKDPCVDHVRKGTLAACVVFPAGMTPVDTKIDEIVFYVDYSRVNIVYQILERVLNEVRSTSSQISVDLTNALLDALTSLQQDVQASEPTLQEITSLQQNASALIRSLSKDITQLSVRYDPNSVELNDASRELGIAQNKVSDVYNGHVLTTKRCDNALDLGLDKALDCASSQDEEDELRKEINASEVFKDQSKIEQAYGDIQQTFNDTRNELVLAQKRLDELGEDLQKIDQLRSKVKDGLSSTDTIVLSADQRTKEIRQMLEQMYTLIDNIQLRNANAITTPVKTTIQPVVPETKNLLYLFPTLLALVLMFSAVMLSSSLVMAEKKSKAYFRNFISPVGSVPTIIGTFATALLIVLLQASILVGIAALYLKTVFSIGMLALLLVLVTALFVLLGQIIGEFFNSEDTVTLGAISMCSAFLFLSDVILPFERMPPIISDLSQFNPFVLASQGMKKILLFTEQSPALQLQFIFFSVAVVVLLFILFMMENLFRRRAINKLTNQYSIRKEKKKEEFLIRDTE
jgi:ABC-type multidrug transport system permease subunit